MEYFYIFNVASGHRFQVEVSPHWKALQLQENIRHLTGIRVDDQVLLRTGGEILDSDDLIQCACPNNNADDPVYLFQRSSRYDKEDSRLWEQEINEITSIIDVSIEDASRLEQDSDMHSVYLGIPQRARGCRAASQTAIHACARFAEEHRLIHQGWMALVNNMDTSIARLRKRAARFQHQVEKVQQQKEKAAALLQGFDEVIRELKQIRVPGPLLAHSRGHSDASSHFDISLYEWISASDPEHTLQELVEQVDEQLRNFGKTDANSTVQCIEKVVELSKDVNCREIKGINKRLSYLNHHLQQAEERDKTIERYTSKIVETPSRIDQSSLEELLSEHRHLMSQIYIELKEIRLICSRFFKSKLEVLTLLRMRLNSWIVRTYDRLHHAHNEVLVFEEKFTGLKQRLDLVRQIKEAPMMYVTAASEVVRRTTFHKEFTSWHALHVERCALFSEEETRIRSQFSAKMEKHFLRVLFHGMFDTLPVFYIKSLPKFDEFLSPIDVGHLRELANNLEELKEYMKVPAPQVYSRLSVRDPSIPSPVVPSVMKREESFFTADVAFSLSALNRNFPSTNWLSADDGMDSSPSTVTAILMTKSPLPRVGSSSSLNMPIAPSLNQLSMLGEEDELPSASVAKSAPIQIPTPQPRQMSEKSSQFSTPDDHFHGADPIEERQFAVDDLISRSQSFSEILKPTLMEVLSISKDMLGLRADLTKNFDYFKESYASIGEMIGRAFTDRLRQTIDLYETKLMEVKKENGVLTMALEKRNEEFESLRARHEDKTKFWSNELATKNAELNKLRSEIEMFESKVRTVKNDTFKEGIIAMELEKNRLSTEYEEIIEAKDAEIGQLSKELEKKCAEIVRLHSDPQSEAYRKNVAAEIRSDLEKDSQSKLDFLTKGILQKKDEILLRIRKEMQYEMELSQQEFNFSMKWLVTERDRLRDYIITNLSEGREFCETVQNDIQSAIASCEGAPRFICGTSVATQTDLPRHLFETKKKMHTSQHDNMKESALAFECLPELLEPLSVPDDTSCSSNQRNEVHIQTKINLQSFNRMVAIEDIGNGSTVLVIWNSEHNSYMLFSSSAYSYFVKESSVLRLGLSPTLPDVPRRNWILGKVFRLEFCIVRKENNRYYLPVGTKMYRVDVKPLDS